MIRANRFARIALRIARATKLNAFILGKLSPSICLLSYHSSQSSSRLLLAGCKHDVRARNGWKLVDDQTSCMFLLWFLLIMPCFLNTTVVASQDAASAWKRLCFEPLSLSVCMCLFTHKYTYLSLYIYIDTHLYLFLCLSLSIYLSLFLDLSLAFSLSLSLSCILISLSLSLSLCSSLFFTSFLFLSFSVICHAGYLGRASRDPSPQVYNADRERKKTLLPASDSWTVLGCVLQVGSRMVIRHVPCATHICGLKCGCREGQDALRVHAKDPSPWRFWRGNEEWDDMKWVGIHHAMMPVACHNSWPHRPCYVGFWPSHMQVVSGWGRRCHGVLSCVIICWQPHVQSEGSGMRGWGRRCSLSRSWVLRWGHEETSKGVGVERKEALQLSIEFSTLTGFIGVGSKGCLKKDLIRKVHFLEGLEISECLESPETSPQSVDKTSRMRWLSNGSRGPSSEKTLLAMTPFSVPETSSNDASYSLLIALVVMFVNRKIEWVLGRLGGTYNTRCRSQTTVCTCFASILAPLDDLKLLSTLAFPPVLCILSHSSVVHTFSPSLNRQSPLESKVNTQARRPRKDIWTCKVHSRVCSPDLVALSRTKVKIGKHAAPKYAQAQSPSLRDHQFLQDNKQAHRTCLSVEHDVHTSYGVLTLSLSLV